MSDSPLPDDVRELLRERIWAHEHVEVLLLLRNEPRKNWTTGEVCAALRLPPVVVPLALEHLASHRLIELIAGAAVQHRYQPVPEGLDAVIDRLGQAYRESPNTILVCLGANAIERVRTAAMRMFADSFLIRRKPDG